MTTEPPITPTDAVGGGAVSAVDRAAQLIASEAGECNDDVNHDGRQWQWAAEALREAGLLVDDDTDRLVRLGRAVEATERFDCSDHYPEPHEVGWNDCLDAIYREAGEP